MTRDDIIRMAKKAELHCHSLAIEDLEHFAALVRDDYSYKPWVGLTDEQIHNTAGYQETREMYSFVRAIEAKLKEKNNG